MGTEIKTVICTRIYDDDAERLKKLAEERGLSVSELLRLLVYDFLEKETELKEELLKIQLHADRKCKDLKKVSGLLGRLVSHTNQMAKSLNRLAKKGETTEREKEQLMQAIGELLALTMQIENWLTERE